MKIKIHVTERHIAEGVRENCKRCPIALAVRPHVKYEYWEQLEIFPSGVFLDSCGMIYFPVQATLFVRNFDNKRPVKAFTFTLDVPRWAEGLFVRP